MNRKVLRILVVGLLVVTAIGSVAIPMASALFANDDIPDGGQPSGGTGPTPTPNPDCGDGGQPSGGTC